MWPLRASRSAVLLLALLLAPMAADAARHAGGKARQTARTGKTTKGKAQAPAADALTVATQAWTRLKADKKRRQYREHWMSAIGRLEKAGDALAPQQDGAVAYMRAAKATEELSRLSKRKQDARRAIELYLRVPDRCPKSSLADDALLAAASLETNRLGEPETAARHLTAAKALKGDRAAEARRLLSTLERERDPSRVAPSVVPVPDRAPVAAPVVVATAPAPTPSEAFEPFAAIPALETGEAEEAPGAEPVTAKLPDLPKAALGQVRNLKSRALAEREWSLSEQVGLKVRRIVIDAGHGGHDTGAIGPTGVYEKDVTLAIAKRLAETLGARGYETVLTRDTDVFLALEERTSAANREKGDLFVSVHANAHRSRRMSGVETYSLNVASNRYAMRLAARENATTESSVSDLQLLLADFATRANTVDSDRLATLVQSNIVRNVSKEYGKVSDHGTKHAMFYVLLGTRMPAVLVETAFLSNPDEEGRLASEAYQATLARAIADGVDQFVARRTQLASLEK